MILIDNKDINRNIIENQFKSKTQILHTFKPKKTNIFVKYNHPAALKCTPDSCFS